MKPTIFKRLVIGNMIMIGFVVFLGAYVVFKLNELQHLSLDIIDTDTKSVDICENLTASLKTLTMFEQKYMISKDADYFNTYEKMKPAFLEEMSLFKVMLTSPGAKELALAAENQFKIYSALFEKEARQIKENREDYDPSLAISEISRLALSIEDKLNQIIVLKNRDKTSKLLLSNAMIGHASKLTGIITLIAIVLGILISVTNTKAITGSIFLLETKTREISKGQFNPIPVMPAAPREIEDLTRHFNVMCTRLKELEVMKTDFISHFSHELRTPVTSIKEASSMLNMQLFHSHPEKEKELSQLILTECDRLITSIEKILDLSKMEVLKMEWDFSKTDIVGVTEKAVATFLPAAENKNITLTFAPAKQIPKTRMDTVRIEEVFNNLISNALKYTPENGHITVTIETIENKKKIMASVLDDGCGIDEKNLEKIFEKFRRIDKGNETLRGTGLGLAISKHIIKAHKGEIWAESDVSKGTKISFVLSVV